MTRWAGAASPPEAEASGLGRWGTPAIGSGVVAAGTVELGTNCAQRSGHGMYPPEDTVTIVDESPARPDEADRDPPPPAIPQEAQDALRRQIARALQPILADFRKESVRAVHEQLEQARATDRADGPKDARSATEPSREEPSTPSRRGEHDSGPTDGVEGQPLPEQGTAPVRSVASEIVGQVPGFLEDAGTRWLRSRLEDGRDALCSGPLRESVRASTEQVLRPLIGVGLELVPDGATRRGLQRDTERALDGVVEDFLARLCSEPVLTEVQRHGERALHALERGDVGTTLREVWEAIQTLLRELVPAVLGQWERVLHLLLDLFLRAVQEMIGTMLKEGLSALAPISAQEDGEKTETTTESLKDKGAELKDRLTERLEALQERVKEEVGQVKQRVADGLQSAVEGGTRESFGRPPTGRPPSLRPPSGRPPTGRPPSLRPPSGRPPSMTRRGA